MKPAADPEFILLASYAREKGIPVQSLRDAASEDRREFDVLRIGKADSRRCHVYARRVDLDAWIERHLQRKAPTSTIRQVSRKDSAA